MKRPHRQILKQVGTYALLVRRLASLRREDNKKNASEKRKPKTDNENAAQGVYLDNSELSTKVPAVMDFVFCQVLHLQHGRLIEQQDKARHICGRFKLCYPSCRRWFLVHPLFWWHP